MFIVVFDAQGVVYKFLSAGQTVDGTFYVEVLNRLRIMICRVRRNIVDIRLLYHKRQVVRS